MNLPAAQPAHVLTGAQASLLWDAPAPAGALTAGQLDGLRAALDTARAADPAHAHEYVLHPRLGSVLHCPAGEGVAYHVAAVKVGTDDVIPCGEVLDGRVVWPATATAAAFLVEGGRHL